MTASASPRFDLLHEPWIPVIDLNDEPGEVGLAELLLRAHELRRIAGFTPPMTAALYRLVLAFAHRAYGPPDNHEWETLWKADRFPPEPLQSYVAGWPGRFDLFDPQRPFLQCPALAAHTKSSAVKLVAFRATGNNATLFDHTTARERPLLSPAEAACWLVTVQAYDTGGTKTPYQSVKSSEKAPGNMFGCVVVEGSTLKETLLLNMPVYEPEAELPAMTTPGDHPAWEDEDPPDPKPVERTPRGWTDVLTWPSRRVLLFTRPSGEGTAVDGVVITPGTRLRGELRHLELMAAFQRPPAPRNSKKPRLFFAVRLKQRRGVWRHSRELLLAGDPDRERPRTLDELSERMDDLHLAEDAEFTLRVIGQQLAERREGAIEWWAEEEVPAPVALLRARDSRIGRLIGFAVTLADNVGSALSEMETAYWKGFQSENTKAKFTGDLDLAYWPHLNEPFTRFLRDLSAALISAGPETPAIHRWGVSVRHVAERAAEHWLNASPRQARALSVAGKTYGAFIGRLKHLVETFEAETAHYAI
ncbi:type I-E CRISPR-associated protein Cse1/CasA [Amycolatopsis rhizosphaerae]|uniref:Type I-E CRISPR-associated protein Cse1/CasA n=1 Tax=Amycolatopsis rhizosphaerae TaxID=2053003 RepID=A0A558AF68_9PSEU|nr:type I-E CRISPR-associated protein Cse1/CasA [Amycolatopsis rhizosphaerae]TVT22900.1 type I-E CRISPR-associated protein Cse1/CasA [Amycolatopsis rhizosphaerae]